MTTRGSENRDLAVYNLDGVNGTVPTAAASLSMGAGLILRRRFIVGAGAPADDVTVLSVGTLPFRFRVLSIWGIIETSPGASTVDVYTRAGGGGGGGTRLGQISTAATGFQASTNAMTATAVAIPSANDGLFFRRSNGLTAGEIFMIIQRTTS